MAVTASELRQNVYRLLDEVLATGAPLEIERHGRRLRIVAVDRPSKFELQRTDPSSAQVCAVAAELSWTRDPFDRLLSAHAVTSGTPLVTKNRVIRKNLPLAWWVD